MRALTCLTLTLALCLLLSGCTGLHSKNQLLELQQQADSAYAKGDYQQSSKLYQQLSKSMPTDAGVRYQLGNSQARAGDNAAAINSYRESLLRDPYNARSWHNLLQVQLREATLSAAEMQRYIKPQAPYAEQALQRAEQLLHVFPQEQ